MSDEIVPIRANTGTTVPERTVVLPCSRCGEKRNTASMYFSAASRRASVQGFHTALSQRLCRPCLEEAIAVLDAIEEATP